MPRIRYDIFSLLKYLFHCYVHDEEMRLHLQLDGCLRMKISVHLIKTYISNICQLSQDL